jgi:hypothetical protein
MNKVITPDQMATADLRSINEIWLSSSTCSPQDTPSQRKLCLWRGEQLFTHDMMSEGTHGQNVSRAWLQVEDLDDRQAMSAIEATVRQRLLQMGLEGEFYPAERADTHE